MVLIRTIFLMTMRLYLVVIGLSIAFWTYYKREPSNSVGGSTIPVLKLNIYHGNKATQCVLADGSFITSQVRWVLDHVLLRDSKMKNCSMTKNTSDTSVKENIYEQRARGREPSGAVPLLPYARRRFGKFYYTIFLKVLGYIKGAVSWKIKF